MVFSHEIMVFSHKIMVFSYEIIGQYYDIWKDTAKLGEKIRDKYAPNGFITGHLSYPRAIGSIGNEFAASITSSLSPQGPGPQK